MIAHLIEGEIYYLRLLLLNFHCPKSYEDLRTYNGVVVNTFHEAALLRGLLQRDSSQELCLEEASYFHMPYEMRRLFVTFLVYSCSNNSRQLLLKFEHTMSKFYKVPNINKM